MSSAHPAVDPCEVVQAEEVDGVRVVLPRDVVNALRAYDSDIAWVVRRALACLVHEEQRQADALAVRKRQRPGRRAVA